MLFILLIHPWTKEAQERQKANVFSTQTAFNSDESKSNYVKPKLTCMWCKDDKHPLSKCPDFMRNSLEDRRTYIKENKLCYGCTKANHSAKECRHRHTCEVRKPTCLHDDNFRRREEKKGTESLGNTDPTAVYETTTATALTVTEGGQSCITSMIIPVWVSSVKNQSDDQLVYALLDTRSDSCFIDREVSNQLHADSYPVKLKLTTLLGENTITDSDRVSGLRVRGYSSCLHINLPPSYTKECILVNQDHIPSSETGQGHLQMSLFVFLNAFFQFAQEYEILL